MTDAPYSQEAEEAVLGAVLTNPLALLNVSAFLGYSDFFFLRNSYVWGAMIRLQQAKEPIDTVTVGQKLQDVGHLVDIGGPAYLTQLIRNTPTSVHAEIYGRLVKRAALRRRLMLACDDIKLLAQSEEVEVEKVFAQSEAMLFEVTDKLSETHRPSDIGSAVDSYFTKLEVRMKAREDGQVIGVPTGYTELDKDMGGVFNGELTTIGAPAGMGKSSFVLGMARSRGIMNLHTVIFTNEMTQGLIIQKLIAMETGVPVRLLKQGKVDKVASSKIVEACSTITKWPIHIIDSYTTLTPIDVERELRRLTQKHDIRSVIIDGLWKMKAETHYEKRNEEVAYIMAKLVATCKEFDLPFELVHQFGRAVAARKDKSPTFSDFAESAAIERDSDVLIGLYRPSYYKSTGADTTEAIVMKNRAGEYPTAKLSFDKRRELYTDKAEEPSGGSYREAPQHRPTTPARTHWND